MADHMKEVKEIRCSDFRPDCDFKAQADTEEGLFKKCEEHACSAHNKCESSPRSRKKMRSHIRSVFIS